MIYHTLYGPFKMTDVDEYFHLAIKDLQESLRNFQYSGDWTFDECGYDHEYDKLKISWIDGEATYDNIYYEKQLLEYKKKIKEYPKLLEDYERKRKEYLDWKSKVDKENEVKEKDALLKQLKFIEKRLEKYGNV